MLGSAPGISFDFVNSSEFACILATDGFVVTMDLLLRNFYVAMGVRYLYSMLPGVFNAVHEKQKVCGSVWQQRLQQRMQQRLQKRLQQRLLQRCVCSRDYNRACSSARSSVFLVVCSSVGNSVCRSVGSNV